MKTASDAEALAEIRAKARQAWLGLFEEDIPLVCTGMSTCGMSARACEAQSALEAELEDRGINARSLNVGCLGLCYAEPLVYIKLPGRPMVCYGHAVPEVVSSLADEAIGNAIDRSDHKSRALGTIDLPEIKSEKIPGLPSIWDHPMLKPQIRIALRNCGIIDPENIQHYIARGGYSALQKALAVTPESVIEEVKVSGLRGRGGAGFPTGMKWEFCRKAKGDEKYLICNADEGDPGAFMDRSVLEGDPHSVIEGMLIAAHSIGSTKGFIYCRAEYPLALKRLDIALKAARKFGLLGDDILGSGMDFDISIKEGAGAFVCGEETALMAELAADEMMDYDYTLNKNRYLVKEAASKNPGIPRDALEWLSRDNDEHVRAAAASNPGIAVEVLPRLSKDISWLVRDRVARNPSTPESLLTYLSADRIMDVRVSVALSPRTPTDALAALAADRSWEVRRAVAQNVGADESILDQLSEATAWMVREAVAKNPRTPRNILERLVKDLDQSVQAAASRALAKRSA